MRWRAMRTGGGNTPAVFSAEYTPEATGASNSIMIGGQYTEEAYRVDIKDPLDVGKRVNIIYRAGTSYSIRERALWEADMWSYGTNSLLGYGSPPFNGSMSMKGSEFDPPHTPEQYYDWQRASNPVPDMTADETTAAVFTEWFHAVTRGGTNLWNIIVREIQRKAEGGLWTVGSYVDFNLYFRNADFPRISVSVATVPENPFGSGVKLPESYYTGAGGYKFWTPEGLADLACIKSIGIGLQANGPSGLIYSGYGSKPLVSDAYYEPGVSGFAKYGTPEFYLFLLPNGNVTLATNTHNNANQGVTSSQWPMIGGWNTGFNPANYGLELLPGIGNEGGGVIQYRVTGWATMR